MTENSAQTKHKSKIATPLLKVAQPYLTSLQTYVMIIVFDQKMCFSANPTACRNPGCLRRGEGAVATEAIQVLRDNDKWRAQAPEYTQVQEIYNAPRGPRAHTDSTQRRANNQWSAHSSMTSTAPIYIQRAPRSKSAQSLHQARHRQWARTKCEYIYNALRE